MPSVFRMCPNKLLSAAKEMTLNYTGKLPKVPQTTSTAAGKASSSNASSSSSAAAEQRLHDENADPNANSASTTPPLEKPSSGANANAAATSPQMFAVQKSEFILLSLSPHFPLSLILLFFYPENEELSAFLSPSPENSWQTINDPRDALARGQSDTALVAHDF